MLPLGPFLLTCQVGTVLVAVVTLVAAPKEPAMLLVAAAPAALVLLIGPLITWFLERRRPATGRLARRILLRYELPAWLVAQPVLLFYAFVAGWFSLASRSPFRWDDAAIAYGICTAVYLGAIALPIAVAAIAWNRARAG
jgi:hypothetical protein